MAKRVKFVLKSNKKRANELHRKRRNSVGRFLTGLLLCPSLFFSIEPMADLGPTPDGSGPTGGGIVVPSTCYQKSNKPMVLCKNGRLPVVVITQTLDIERLFLREYTFRSLPISFDGLSTVRALSAQWRNNLKFIQQSPFTISLSSFNFFPLLVFAPILSCLKRSHHLMPLLPVVFLVSNHAIAQDIHHHMFKLCIA